MGDKEAKQRGTGVQVLETQPSSVLTGNRLQVEASRGVEVVRGHGGGRRNLVSKGLLSSIEDMS